MIPAGLQQQMQGMVQQGYQQLQRRPQPNIEAMRAKYGTGDPAQMQARMNQMQQRYGQPVVDYAAQQQRLQQMAQMKADALRQKQEQVAAMQDPNNPANPNMQFALAQMGQGGDKNQAPPDPYGGLVGGGN